MQRRAVELSEQLPSTREIAGQEQREEQPDALDWLNRSKIHPGTTASGAGSEQDQEQRYEQRAGEREIAQRQERRLAEIHERDRAHQSDPEEHSLGVADEQHRIPQRIRTTEQQCEPDRRQQMGSREQDFVAANASVPPQQSQQIESGEIRSTVGQATRAKVSDVRTTSNGLSATRSSDVKSGRAPGGGCPLLAARSRASRSRADRRKATAYDRSRPQQRWL